MGSGSEQYKSYNVWRKNNPTKAKQRRNSKKPSGWSRGSGSKRSSPKMSEIF